jgi:hypothetical protein
MRFLFTMFLAVSIAAVGGRVSGAPESSAVEIARCAPCMAES